mmetsp:Transcript_141199/g.393506  ORF Transcript_141199/g.393506 Transcript_141199/m.393506 type:complete len:308 (+) Transcript_141199:425-1348(+)
MGPSSASRAISLCKSGLANVTRISFAGFSSTREVPLLSWWARPSGSAAPGAALGRRCLSRACTSAMPRTPGRPRHSATKTGTSRLAIAKVVRFVLYRSTQRRRGSNPHATAATPAIAGKQASTNPALEWRGFTSRMQAMISGAFTEPELTVALSHASSGFSRSVTNTSTRAARNRAAKSTHSDDIAVYSRCFTAQSNVTFSHLAPSCSRIPHSKSTCGETPTPPAISRRFRGWVLCLVRVRPKGPSTWIFRVAWEDTRQHRDCAQSPKPLISTCVWPSCCMTENGCHSSAEMLATQMEAQRCPGFGP